MGWMVLSGPTPMRPPLRRRLALLLLVAPALLGGTCGSVLRRYDPVGWEWDHSKNGYARTIGDLHIVVSGVVKQTSHMTLSIENRGSSAVELRGVELQTGEVRKLWTPEGGVARVDAGARVELDVSFHAPLEESRCVTTLLLSTGPVAIAHELP